MPAEVGAVRWQRQSDVKQGCRGGEAGWRWAAEVEIRVAPDVGHPDVLTSECQARSTTLIVASVHSSKLAARRGSGGGSASLAVSSRRLRSTKR